LEIDVVIPVYNQKSSLSLVLKGFSQQITAHKVSIIVVDDGSTEDIFRVVEEKRIEFQNKNIILKYTRLENSGRSIARNHGVSLGEGELIIFCDADRIPDKNFIEMHAREYVNEAGITIGLPLEIYLSSLFDREPLIWEIVNGEKGRLARKSSFIKLALSIYNNDGNTDSGVPWISTFSGNMSSSRALMESFRFDDGFKFWGFENIELGYRLYSAGVKFRHSSSVKNYHLAHSRPSNFYENGIKYSRDYLTEKYGESSAVTNFSTLAEGSVDLRWFEQNYGNPQASWQLGTDAQLINKISYLT
jgi:glycosyltransferase involved in cell wall biosynthesis